MHTKKLLALFMGLSLLLSAQCGVREKAPERVLVAPGGQQQNADSYNPSISGDGHYVVFQSRASDLVSDDTNGWDDVFVYELETGQTTRVSVASDGTQGNGASVEASISADGSRVAFGSRANNLVGDDNNGRLDFFVHERQTSQTTYASVAAGGIKGDDIFYILSISGNGRYLVFQSNASNLVKKDTNKREDAFIHDLETGQTARVSVASNGRQGKDKSGFPVASYDGRYVVFDSSARNLVGGDTNAASDVFVHDRQTGQTTRVSVTTDGTQGNGHSTWPSISGDGQYVTFVSKASNLVSGDTNGVSDVFVHDRKTGQPTRASTASDGTQGNGGSQNPSLSFDGRYVVFWSGATNLIDGDTNGVWDIFVHDRETGETTRVSVASDGTQGNDISRFPSISADGRYVAFESDADNLVSGDTNGFSDIFVHDRETGETICVSIPGE